MNSVVIAPFHGKLGELALIAGPALAPCFH